MAAKKKETKKTEKGKAKKVSTPRGNTYEFTGKKFAKEFRVKTQPALIAAALQTAKQATAKQLTAKVGGAFKLNEKSTQNCVAFYLNRWKNSGHIRFAKKAA
ncbi:hypothetical protein LCGC14_1009190 [marine sediment metagenome]|uniref:Uncharacterized protein n=1 Tax=marine sediment metagenome TaxID=412755 RepID=A0A0F9N0T4_9ZZZZ